MEERWSVEEDKPLLREERKTPWQLWAMAALALAVAAGYFWYVQQSREAPPAPVAAPAPAPAPAAEPAPAPAPVAAASGEPIRNPLPKPPERSLPSLENSDSMMRSELSALLGREAFTDFVYPYDIVRRIVATVDNLPRKTPPAKMSPVKRVPGKLAVVQAGDELRLDAAANSARYDPLVRVFGALEARKTVRVYAEIYPLFQRAYEDLGYPGKYFNDRLVEAIEDLLAAPDPKAAILLAQPKTLYEFADPELEALSSGQKIMIRMGSQNAAKVKAKLREFLKELKRAG